MYCSCQKPHKIVSEANGEKFEMCSKNLGGCGQEIKNKDFGHYDFCQYGNCNKKGERFRQNTAYIEEERNWFVACEEHQIAIDEYWAEMWADYYSGS